MTIKNSAQRPVSKANKTLTTQEYRDLLKIAAVVRDIYKVGLTNGYGRVFTEPRENGLRTKFWIAKPNGYSSAVLDKVVKYLKNNKTGVEATLDVYDRTASLNKRIWVPSSVSIHLKVVDLDLFLNR